VTLLPGLAAAQGLTPSEQLGRDIFRELIEINTDHAVGSTTVAAQALAKRLLAAGYPAGDVQVIGPDGSRNHNLVARLRGSGRGRPVLFLAHLDVVEARRDDWSLDPYTFTERDGYFYGRGTQDIKEGAAALVGMLIRMKQEGFVPTRDVIVALTAGEESGGDYNGVDWLIKNHRDLIDAEYCINVDGGGAQLKGGKRFANAVQASEKLFVSFRLEVRNPGGHSSLPTEDNAIYRLAAALTRVAGYRFPVHLTEVTRSYFNGVAQQEGGSTASDLRAVLATPSAPEAAKRLSKSPFNNAMLRTTCVATLLEAGHAINALPQLARASVNCRLIPGDSPDSVERALKRVVADTAVAVTPLGKPTPSAPSPLRPEIMRPITRVTESMWPGVPVIPFMDTGATDGLFLRNVGIPTYGVNGVFIDVDDIRAHGRDERVGVKDFYQGLEFHYRLGRALTGAELTQ